ncbi:recombinase family protein [Bradyrhizobium jicamae]|uniref:recombinase family protein n=1 Tax=Bradyrhizobium jicamae TaxID=280332 RepID=UPI001BA84315|nr:recombinase family protein [Bradyrhizobium jicamae]MBR0758274.1 recombinase family protein [Bradyrhizobium jicamae]
MRRPKLVEHAATEIRAAQYVRMSTSEQKYSIGNQAARIAAYAARRNISIVRTYSDPGKSGVQIAGRRGLQDLIRDVQLARADFSCVLFYDVTRWGRFQDVDESAYYEFICKQAGISVHYCEDDFENDGSFASDIVKVNKRAAAADFSKQLSRKVFFGQCNVITPGYWRGGPAGYGLRRMLINEAGKPVQILEYGQRKSPKSQHVILVPGPKAEIRIVQSIFDLFVNKKKSRQAIAEHLNAKRLLNARGNAWTMQTISNTLEGENLEKEMLDRSTRILSLEPG